MLVASRTPAAEREDRLVGHVTETGDAVWTAGGPCCGAEGLVLQIRVGIPDRDIRDVAGNGRSFRCA